MELFNKNSRPAVCLMIHRETQLQKVCGELRRQLSGIAQAVIWWQTPRILTTRLRADQLKNLSILFDVEGPPATINCVYVLLFVEQP